MRDSSRQPARSGQLLGLAQRLFRLLAVGDVHANAQHPLRLLNIVEYHPSPRDDPAHRAVGPDCPVLHLVVSRAHKRLLDRLLATLTIFGMNKRCPVF